MQKHKKLIIFGGVILFLAVMLWPVKVACGRKDYVCSTAPISTDDGKSEICSFYTIEPNFSAAFNFDFNYGRNSRCRKF